MYKEDRFSDIENSNFSLLYSSPTSILRIDNNCSSVNFILSIKFIEL